MVSGFFRSSSHHGSFEPELFVWVWPFLPNSGYAFVVIHPAYSLLKSSWHGREAITVPVERSRLSILNTYYREAAPQHPAGM